MSKEIHFYEYEHPLAFEMENGNLTKMLYGYRETDEAIQRGKKYIHTTQMGLLSSTLLHKKHGYRVFIHPKDKEMYEITLKTKENNGERTVRYHQNAYRMWAGGVFDLG